MSSSKKKGLGRGLSALFGDEKTNIKIKEKVFKIYDASKKSA